MMGRVLAVDPGEKRLGIAISDETGTLATPVMVINHTSLENDVKIITQLIKERSIVLVIVGTTVSIDGSELPQTRHARRVSEEIHARANIPVILWDEWGSTQAARAARLASGAPRSKRGGHLDDVAAALILQSYLDSRPHAEQMAQRSGE
ncbi:MAG TPA: Holliday junction resolvase RuvX [Longilinea sp.]|nr:Holliday junction resolvase RuvX [Longilinea sp.]